LVGGIGQVKGHGINAHQALGECVDFGVGASSCNANLGGSTDWVGVDAPVGNCSTALRNVLLEQV
jgi:hypothetical protein